MAWRDDVDRVWSWLSNPADRVAAGLTDREARQVEASRRLAAEEVARVVLVAVATSRR